MGKLCYNGILPMVGTEYNSTIVPILQSLFDNDNWACFPPLKAEMPAILPS